MTNDNVKEAVSAMKPAPDVTQNILYQHVDALLSVHLAALKICNAISPDDCSPEEKALFDAVQNEVLLKPGSETLMLQLLEQVLLFVLPGADIMAESMGLSKMQAGDGERAIGIVLKIQQGKNAVNILRREAAEQFEKGLKKALDEHFGRMIRI